VAAGSGAEADVAWFVLLLGGVFFRGLGGGTARDGVEALVAAGSVNAGGVLCEGEAAEAEESVVLLVGVSRGGEECEVLPAAVFEGELAEFGLRYDV
jgi:hypothetical protein